MKRTKTTPKTTPQTYRESIMKPGAARIALTGYTYDLGFGSGPRSSCNPFLGGTADEACIFVNAAEARKEIEALRNSRDNARVIAAWEIHTLRADGLWQGCVAAGVFEKPVEDRQ